MGKKKVGLTAKELVLKKYPSARLIKIYVKYFRVQVESKCKHCVKVTTKTLGEGLNEEWAWQNASTFIKYAKSEKKKKK